MTVQSSGAEKGGPAFGGVSYAPASELGALSLLPGAVTLACTDKVASVTALWRAAVLKFVISSAAKRFLCGARNCLLVLGHTVTLQGGGRLGG